MNLTKLITVTFATLLSGCIACNNPGPPDKVEGILKNAFWIGGIDGGNWYVLGNIDTLKRTVNFQIYNEQTGERLLAKELNLHCNSNSFDWSNLLDNLIAFDGQKVLLRNIDNTW